MALPDNDVGANAVVVAAITAARATVRRLFFIV
jgi:hypothetical protein